jgi:hypothetical protein
MGPVPLTPAHEQLLRAVLCRGNAVRDAYHAWRTLVRFDDIDDESYRLLPWLSAQLQAEGVVDDLSPRLGGILRRTWYANQLALRAYGTAFDALRHADIDVRLLGGGLSMLAGWDLPGLYPLDGCDALTRPDQHERSIALLEAQGWRARSSTHDAHVLAFEETRFLTLHRQVVHGLAPDARGVADAYVWGHPRRVATDGRELLLVSPEAQLLFIADHGLKGGVLPMTRCLAETGAVLKECIDIDWAGLAAQARLRDLHADLGLLLDSLAPIVADLVPSHLRAALSATEELRSEEHGVRPAWPSSGLTRWTQAGRCLWGDYRGAAADRREPATLLGFARYLVLRWRLASPWHLPWAIVRRLFRGRPA